MIFAPGQAAVTHGAADNETARGVDKDLAILLVEQAGGFQHGTDDRALHGFDDIGLGSGRGVLRGHDHVVDADRLAVDVLKKKPASCRRDGRSPPDRPCGPW